MLYQQVDELIGILRLTTYDDSGRIAHVLFLNKALYDRATFIAAASVGLSLYLSESIRDALSKVNFILLKVPRNASESQAFDIGVAERDALSELRQNVEHQVAIDLLRLHKVRQFLKGKQRLTGKARSKFLAWLPKYGGFSFGKEQADQ